ncbi:hypothetical protein BC835DRAFT_1304667 [Cytidiella melzeri]|nr:hypothetical protein BC835DRAFT_1304667 [Cytidiella melzeri]
MQQDAVQGAQVVVQWRLEKLSDSSEWGVQNDHYVVYLSATDNLVHNISVVCSSDPAPWDIKNNENLLSNVMATPLLELILFYVASRRVVPSAGALYLYSVMISITVVPDAPHNVG